MTRHNYWEFFIVS